MTSIHYLPRFELDVVSPVASQRLIRDSVPLHLILRYVAWQVYVTFHVLFLLPVEFWR